jgi:hypothetical protein
MSLAPIHSLPSRFSPVYRHQPARAPIERIERSADLLGAPPEVQVSYQTTAAEALSGARAASMNTGTTVPLYAPGARFDARA